jgi:hypothetical protein
MVQINRIKLVEICQGDQNIARRLEDLFNQAYSTDIGAVTGTSLAVTGALTSSGTSGIGYATGAGGTVTQVTSRTTGITLNKVTGAVTMVSAAGSTAYQSFNVTNSTVAVTDTIVLNQVSGTDKYILMVTKVSAGSFQISFATTGGTTTEQPVFRFTVLKSVSA